MLHPLRTALPRVSRSSSSLIPQAQGQLRRYSQRPSQTGNFYKTFSRPVAKCALLAVLVYQLVYFGWTKLEVNEIKADRQAEIINLEAQVKGLQAVVANAEAEANADASASASASSSSEGGDGGEQGKGRGSGWWSWK